MKKLPKHILFVIAHEENVMKARLHQVKGYEERIKLLKEGIDYDEVLRKSKPRLMHIKFNFAEYNKLRREEKK